MTEQPYHTWRHWRDKYGMEEALESYFEETLKREPVLTVALAQIKMAELAINAVMAKLDEENPDD